MFIVGHILTMALRAAIHNPHRNFGADLICTATTTKLGDDGDRGGEEVDAGSINFMYFELTLRPVIQ